MLKCQCDRCGVAGIDHKLFWPVEDGHLCLKCMEEFNLGKQAILDKISELQTKLLKDFYDRFLIPIVPMGKQAFEEATIAESVAVPDAPPPPALPPLPEYKDSAMAESFSVPERPTLPEIKAVPAEEPSIEENGEEAL